MSSKVLVADDSAFARRTLRRVRMADAAAAERVFELLMGNDVAPRKEFIVQGAYAVDADTIDA